METGVTGDSAYGPRSLHTDMLTEASCQLPAWLRPVPAASSTTAVSVLSRIRESGILNGHVGWGRDVLSTLLLLPLRVVWGDNFSTAASPVTS